VTCELLCNAAVIVVCVVTVTVTAAEAPEPRFDEPGDTEQLAYRGAPPQVKLTVPENPFAAVAVRLYEAVAPLTTVADVEPPAGVENDTAARPVPLIDIAS